MLSISSLEKTLTTAIQENGSLNPLADLVHLLATNDHDPAETHKALYALYRLFTLLTPKLFLPQSSSPSSSSSSPAVKDWLWRQFDVYTDKMVSLLGDETEPLRTGSLKILMELLKSLSDAAKGMHNKLFKKIVHGLLSAASDDVLELWWNEWGTKFSDVRWFFLREAADPAAERRNLLVILERIRELPDELTGWFVAVYAEGKPVNEPDVRVSDLPAHKAVHSVASHRAMFTKAWMKVFSNPLSEQESIRILKILHRQVVPYMSPPSRVVEVVDWVSGTVNSGDTSQAFLAMNTLFLLMTKHNIDYPNFYPQLLKLLTPDLLHSKHRSRFLRLLTVFLGPSNHLSVALLEEFCLRLGELAMTGPPGGIIPTLILVYNVIISSRGSLMPLIHSDGDEKQKQLRTLASLMNHYLPSVCTLSKLYSQPFNRKDPLGLESFLDIGYHSLLEKDLKRSIKKEPAVGEKRKWDECEWLD